MTENTLPPAVLPAIISASVTLLGFLVQGIFISRWIDKQRLKDTTTVQRKSERRESLVVLFNASCIAKSAARDLSDHSVGLTSEELVHRTADSLQKMSQFFQKSSEAERDLHLITADVAQVKVVQAALVNVFLLLDPDSKDPDAYRQRLRVAYAEFEKEFNEFQSYVRSVTADS